MTIKWALKNDEIEKIDRQSQCYDGKIESWKSLVCAKAWR